MLGEFTSVKHINNRTRNKSVVAESPRFKGSTFILPKNIVEGGDKICLL